MFDLCHCQWELWFNPYGYRASWWKRNNDKSWLTITATLKQVSIVTGLKLYNKLGCHTRQITPWRGPFLKAFGFLCSLKIKMQASYFQLVLSSLFSKHSLFSWSQIIWGINMFAQEMYKLLSTFQPLFPLKGEDKMKLWQWKSSFHIIPLIKSCLISWFRECEWGGGWSMSQ